MPILTVISWNLTGGLAFLVFNEKSQLAKCNKESSTVFSATFSRKLEKSLPLKCILLSRLPLHAFKGNRQNTRLNKICFILSPRYFIYWHKQEHVEHSVLEKGILSFLQSLQKKKHKAQRMKHSLIISGYFWVKNRETLFWLLQHCKMQNSKTSWPK